MHAGDGNTLYLHDLNLMGNANNSEDSTWEALLGCFWARTSIHLNDGVASIWTAIFVLSLFVSYSYDSHRQVHDNSVFRWVGMYPTTRVFRSDFHCGVSYSSESPLLSMRTAIINLLLSVWPPSAQASLLKFQTHRTCAVMRSWRTVPQRSSTNHRLDTVRILLRPTIRLSQPRTKDLDRIESLWALYLTATSRGSLAPLARLV